MKTYTADEITALAEDDFSDPRYPFPFEVANKWLERGDGIAVYENQDLGHPEVGAKRFVSFGSPAAQLEGAEAPQFLPDIGNAINWRYVLIGTYRGDPLSPSVKS